MVIYVHVNKIMIISMLTVVGLICIGSVSAGLSDFMADASGPIDAKLRITLQSIRL